MARLYPTLPIACSWAELLEGALDLRVHVQRLLALANASFVARYHQLADLLCEPWILAGGGGCRGEQPGELSLDVQGLPSPPDGAVAARREHLADLILLLGPRGR
jgi:hypothetical protein